MLFGVTVAAGLNRWCGALQVQQLILATADHHHVEGDSDSASAS